MTPTARSPLAADAAMGDALLGYEKIFLVAGIFVAHGFLIHVWLYPSGSDAVGYVLAARDIATNGLFSKFYVSDVRTYGYPAFLAIVDGFASTLRSPFQIVLLEVQLMLYTGSALILRGELMKWGATTAARIVFCGLLANYYAMIYAAESLGESLSLSLTLLAAACWLRIVRVRNAEIALILGSLIVGFAVMIRPANLFLVLAWISCCGLLWVRERLPASQVLIRSLAILAAMSLPAIPQVINNAIHYNNPTPLVAYDLRRLQHAFGTKLLKYATGMPPVPHASIVYENPLLEGTSSDSQSPLAWYLNYPVRGLATVALHIFNLTDQDLTFTYARDLDPWYRRPLGVVNHAVIALGLLGFVLLARGLRIRRHSAYTEAFVGLSLLLAANVAIYALSAVEMRFGLTLLLAMFPLAGYGIFRAAMSGSFRVRLLVACFALAYVVGATLLSDWVRSQSPQIREAIMVKRAVEASQVFRCPLTYDFALPAEGEGWSIPERHPEGGFAMWMAARHAWLTLPVSCKGPVLIKLSLVGYMAEDILDGLSLTVNGTNVLLTRGMGPDGRLLLSGLGPRLTGARAVRIDLEVPRTIVPTGGDRTLAVMFSRVEIEPLDRTVAQ